MVSQTTSLWEEIMKRLAFLAVVACLGGCALGGTARADTITFGTTEVFPITGSPTEGAFTYTVVSGGAWTIVGDDGNPPASLTTGLGTPSPGDEIDFFLTGGGLFTFDSFDFSRGS